MVEDDENVLWALTAYIAMISLMAIGGGVIALAPDIHRFAVDNRGWLTDQEFATHYTLAQIAPGPNMLFVTLIGYQLAGWLGAILATLAMIVPPALLAYFVAFASQRSTGGNFGRSMRNGLAPIAVGMTLASSVVVAQAAQINWRGGLLILLTVIIMMRSTINPIWLILAGAIIGIVGIV